MPRDVNSSHLAQMQWIALSVPRMKEWKPGKVNLRKVIALRTFSASAVCNTCDANMCAANAIDFILLAVCT